MKQQQDRIVTFRLHRPDGIVSVSMRHTVNSDGDYCFVVSSVDASGYTVLITEEERKRLAARIRAGDDDRPLLGERR